MKWGVMFRRRKPVPWNDPAVLRQMVVDLYLFVQSELETDPHPLEAYFTDPMLQQAATALQRWAATHQREAWTDAFR